MDRFPPFPYFFPRPFPLVLVGPPTFFAGLGSPPADQKQSNFFKCLADSGQRVWQDRVRVAVCFVGQDRGCEARLAVDGFDFPAWEDGQAAELASRRAVDLMGKGRVVSITVVPWQGNSGERENASVSAFRHHCLLAPLHSP